MPSDEELLARAVIKQALADSGVGAESGKLLSVSENDRGAAISFLTTAGGSWAEAREFWSSLADLDPDRLRTGAMRLLGIEARAPKIEASFQLFHPVPKTSKRRPMVPGVDRHRIIKQLLERPEGATVEDLIERFGWVRTTALGVITGDLRAFGYAGVRGPDGRYRLVVLPPIPVTPTPPSRI